MHIQAKNTIKSIAEPINILFNGTPGGWMVNNLRPAFNIWVAQNTITNNITMLDGMGKFTEIIVKISYLMVLVYYINSITTIQYLLLYLN